jgi:hypothetical protein
MKKVVWVILVVLFFGIALGVALLSMEHTRGSSQATGCEGNLTVIASGMHRYHEKYGHFPPAYLKDKSGKPAHSWRVLLLEFWEPEVFAQYKFDEPWDGPNNRQLAHRMPRFYACPADQDAIASSKTNYFVVVGNRTVFPGANTVKLSEIVRPTGETILVVEAVGLEVNWMEPNDLSFDSMSFAIDDETKPCISSKHRKGPFVCMVDASKKSVRDIDPQRLRELFLTRPE